MYIILCNLESTDHIRIKTYPTDATAREGDRLEHCVSSHQRKSRDTEMQNDWHKVKRLERNGQNDYPGLLTYI